MSQEFWSTDTVSGSMWTTEVLRANEVNANGRVFTNRALREAVENYRHQTRWNYGIFTGPTGEQTQPDRDELFDRWYTEYTIINEPESDIELPEQVYRPSLDDLIKFCDDRIVRFPEEEWKEFRDEQINRKVHEIIKSKLISSS